MANQEAERGWDGGGGGLSLVVATLSHFSRLPGMPLLHPLGKPSVPTNCACLYLCRSASVLLTTRSSPAPSTSPVHISSGDVGVPQITARSEII